jgi:hypothetical protein
LLTAIRNFSGLSFQLLTLIFNYFHLRLEKMHKTAFGLVGTPPDLVCGSFAFFALLLLPKGLFYYRLEIFM